MYSFIKACMKKSSVRTQTGSFYCHAHYYCHFLLLLQKKVTKEKEAGKENRFLQFAIINEQLTIGQCLYFLFRRGLLTGKPVVKHRQDNSSFCSPAPKNSNGSRLFRVATAPIESKNIRVKDI
jgi:hypothetical protein